MTADIRLFQPRSGCAACVPTMFNSEDVIYELNRPDGCLHRGHPVAWNEQRAGSLLHLNALASATAVELWLGWLAGRVSHSHWIRIDWPGGGLPQFRSLDVARSHDCPFCNEKG